MADEYSSVVKFTKLDADANPVTAARFSARSLPTIVVFKAGREVDRIVGYAGVAIVATKRARRRESRPAPRWQHSR
jgi:thioredoxin-like negative regulator of GroEL